MSRKVIENLAVKYENVAKGVCRQMGGKVLNYEAKDILNRGRAEGEAEGIARMQRAAKLLRMGKSISDVAELTELSEETVTELAPVIHAVRFFILILVSAHIFMISRVLCAWTQTKNIILCITML